LLEWAAVKSPEARIDLHYGARRPALLIYREAVERHRGKALRNLRMYLYAEEPGTASDIVAGRVSADRAWQDAADAPASRFYLSGPKAMIDSLRARLIVLGAAAASVISDEWG
jgi:ferredoxin-NADP reductase